MAMTWPQGHRVLRDVTEREQDPQESLGRPGHICPIAMAGPAWWAADTRGKLCSWARRTYTQCFQWPRSRIPSQESRLWKAASRGFWRSCPLFSRCFDLLCRRWLRSCLNFLCHLQDWNTVKRANDLGSSAAMLCRSISVVFTGFPRWVSPFRCLLKVHRIVKKTVANANVFVLASWLNSTFSKWESNKM